MAQPKSKEPSRQLNVRSVFARMRASQLAKATGMSVTQVVEDALRAYQPARRVARPAGLVEKAGVLVKPKGPTEITQAQVDAELEDIRAGGR
jgi:hypothetical protein